LINIIVHVSFNFSQRTVFEISGLQKQLEEAEAVTAQLQAGVDAGLKNVSDRTTSISRVMM
jgi:hypothetical protein